MSEQRLGFWKDYLLQTRKEIDLEKTEGTRILHLKILLVGALLVVVRGPGGVVAFVFLPIVMLALDLMQQSRLNYIIHRWEYLTEVVVPKLRMELDDPDARFFEEYVVKRHKEKFYLPLEQRVRTLLFLPSVAASAAGASILAWSVWKGSLSGAYVTGIGWLALLVAVATVKRSIYLNHATIVGGGVVMLGAVVDWALGGPGLAGLRVLVQGG